MAYEQKDGQGILFVNDKKGNEKAPDRKGTLTVGGVTYNVAGWIKEGKKGPFLSLKAELPKAKDEGEKHKEPAKSDMDDEIPF